MKRARGALSVVFGLVTACGFVAAFAAPADPPEILAIRQLYAEAQQRLKADSAAKIEYYDADRPDGNGDGWYAGKPPEGDDAKQVYGTATIYRVGDRVSFVIVDDSDGAAGDWSRHAEYYFRADGSLAFLFSELRTFYGGVREERRLYFDAAGARLRESRSAFDLHSGKRRKDLDYQRQDVPIYRSVGALTAVFPR